MTSSKFGHRCLMVVWIGFAITINISTISAQRFDGAVYQPISDQKHDVLYAIDLWTMAIPSAQGENAASKSFEKILSSISAQKIEIQGVGDYCVLPFPIQISGQTTEEISNEALQNRVSQLTGTPTVVATFSPDKLHSLLKSTSTKESDTITPTIILVANQTCALMDGSIRPITTSAQRVMPKGDDVAIATDIKGICDGSMAEISIKPNGDEIRLDLKMNCISVKGFDKIEIPECSIGGLSEEDIKPAVSLPVIDARSFHISSSLALGDCLIIIPSWDSVHVRTKEYSNSSQSVASYVSNLFASNTTENYDARIVFVVRVGQRATK